MSPRPSRAWSSSRCLHANEVGVNLKNGYNGDLGKAQMVKKMCPVQTTTYERECRTALGHIQKVEYITFLTV